MAETPIKMKKHSGVKSRSKPLNSPSSLLSPQTPNTQTPSRRFSELNSSAMELTPVRRSSRRLSLPADDFIPTPEKPTMKLPQKTLPKSPKTPKSAKKSKISSPHVEKVPTHEPFQPKSPALSEKGKRKRGDELEIVAKTRAQARTRARNVPKKRVYYKRVMYDEGEFAVGDDVYVKRRENASSDEEDPEVEECKVCFRGGRGVMIECDDCLGGFHLKCVKPPLKEVPEGDWICGFCEAKKSGKEVELPKPPKGKKRVRTLKEKLLTSDLWAARIERYTVF